MRLVPALAAALTLVVCGPAAAAETTSTVTGWSGAPGPASYDKVFVTKFGKATAKDVLVLVPGTGGGAGNFTLVAREIVKQAPGVQVWAMDRRSEALEDTSVLEQAAAGKVTPKQALDFYLGWIADNSIQPHYEPKNEANLKFVHDWGLRVLMEDVRRVVLSARKAGKRVILGGHSLGASAAVAYAAWDFAGRAGHRDLKGLVLIDGGLRGSFRSAGLSDARKRLAEQRQGSPFLDITGVGIPWTAGPFAEIGALAALKDPTGPSILQSFPLLPANLKAPIPATNRGAFGFAFDPDTSPKELALIQARMGGLAAEGDPRDWADGEVTPVLRLAQMFASSPVNGVEWYYPKRLNLDVDAASPVADNSAARFLGLRLRHRAKIALPIYALQSSLTDGRVLKGARSLIKASRIPAKKSLLVDAGGEQSHLDALTAAPQTNKFLDTVVPWLEGLG